MTAPKSTERSVRPGIDADVVGGEVDFTPPPSPDQKNAVDAGEGVIKPTPPAEDENQAGFIGERNLPKSRT